MALVRRGASKGDAGTDATGAHVALRAGVCVVAGRSVGLADVAARSIPVACPGLMALVRGGAGEGSARADASRAHVCLRARVLVIAARYLLTRANPVALSRVAATGGCFRAVSRVWPWVVPDGDTGTRSHLAREDAALARAGAGAVAAHALGRALVAAAIGSDDAGLAVGQLGAATAVEASLARAALVNGGAAGTARRRGIAALVGEAVLGSSGRGAVPLAIAVGGRGQTSRRTARSAATSAGRPVPASSGAVARAIPGAVPRGRAAGHAKSLGIGAARGDGQAGSHLARQFAGHAKPGGRIVATRGVAAHALRAVTTRALGGSRASGARRLQAA